MAFAIIKILDESDVIDISSLDEAREAAAHRDRKATQRREFATLMRSIKTMVRETT